MTDRKIIYLMRHAKPELPYGGRVYYGQTDYPLSQEGLRSAAEVGNYLKGKIDFDYVYASDMTRAKQTAELAAPGKEIRIAPELREVNLGAWEGRSYDDVRAQFTEIYEARGAKFAEVAPPGGETFVEMQRRTVPAFEKIVASHKSGRILIVVHGGTIWTISAKIFGYDLNDMYFFLVDYCGISVLEAMFGRYRLCQHNWRPGLFA